MLERENLRIEDSTARLGRNPKHLEDLWQEWEFGIGGRKAAKLITSSERGKKKVVSTYSRRMHF